MNTLYQKLGQFGYYDQRDWGEVTEEEGVDEGADPKQKYIKVKATIAEDIKTFRAITVYEGGRVVECEWNDQSSLARTRTLFNDGQWALSFEDLNTEMHSGITVIYTDEVVHRGEAYQAKWHGYLEDTLKNGDKHIGKMFNGEWFGEWKVVSKEGNDKSWIHSG